MDLSLVRILVVVAISKVKTFTAEVEKGSMATAFGYGLVDFNWLMKDFRIVFY